MGSAEEAFNHPSSHRPTSIEERSVPTVGDESRLSNGVGSILDNATLDCNNLSARLLAAACISLAYTGQLRDGGSVEADEVRGCLLRSLGLSASDTSQLRDSTLTEHDNSTTSWLDVVMD